jgi:hypothetical protein
MAKTAKAEKVIQASAKNYRRMDLAAQQYGVSVALLKKLINEGRLCRYKLGAATMIDTTELEKLIVVDAGNHGTEAAPGASKA